MSKNRSAFNKFTNLETINSNKNINKEELKTRSNCKSTDEDKVIERATQIVMYVSKNLKFWCLGGLGSFLNYRNGKIIVYTVQ